MPDQPEPRIVPEGAHFQYTANGGVMAGEFSRPVVTRCDGCPAELSLRIVANEPISDEECDRLLTEHLQGAGWSCSHGSDVCPNCRSSTVNQDTPMPQMS